MNHNTTSPGSNFIKSSDFGDDLGSMVDRSLRLDGTPPRRWPRNPLYQSDAVSQLQPAAQIQSSYPHSPERPPVPTSSYSGHYAAQPPVVSPPRHGRPPVPLTSPQPSQQPVPQHAPQHVPPQRAAPQAGSAPESLQPQQYVPPNADYRAPARTETVNDSRSANSYAYNAQRSPSSPLSGNSSNYSSPVSSPPIPQTVEVPSQQPQPQAPQQQQPQQQRAPIPQGLRSPLQINTQARSPSPPPQPLAQPSEVQSPQAEPEQSVPQPISTGGHASPRSPSHVPVRQGDRWNQEGAATLVRKTTDEQGNVTTRVIKKGVEDFDFKDELGTGSYSTVVAACDKQTLRQYAIKILDKAHIIKEDKVKYVEIEKNTLTRLGDHPGIIHLYYTFQDRASLFFVLDFAPNGELLHLVKRMGSLDEACARYYAAQLLDAIEYIHSKGVIHRDLKPENILLDYKMRIKITDFGTAKLLQRDASTGEYPTDSCRATSFVGTAEYVSPELLSAKAQGKATDLWAFGCVLYQMIAGSPPFQGSTQYLTFQRIVRFQYNIPPGFPYLVRDLVKGIFVNPNRRLTASRIREHPFFEGQDWSAKALWNTAPPRLAPYRPTPSSMSASSRPGQRRQQPAPRATPQLLPGADGLRHAQPQTRAGIPTRPAPRAQPAPQAAASSPAQPRRTSPTETPVGLGIGHAPASGPSSSSSSSSRPAERPRPTAPSARSGGVSASSAAAAALRGPAAQRQRHASNTQHSATYQQSQERLQALTRAVRERGGNRSSPPVTLSQAGPASSSSQAQAASRVRAAASPRTPGGASTPPLGYSMHATTSPRSPALPTPQMTTLEGEWSSALISSTERILRIGSVMVHVGPNNRDHSAGDLETPEERESRLQKLFSPRKKKRLLMVTTAGRMLVIGEDRKVRFEVPLGVPQVEVRVVSSARRGSSSLVVETYNRVLTIDDDEKSIAEWMKTVDLSKRFYAQATAEQERNASSAATAAALAVSRR